MKDFAKLILPLAAPGLYTYKIPLKMRAKVSIGDRVVVQFGRGLKLYIGIVADFTNIYQGDKVKSIQEVLEQSATVNDSALRFWNWMAEYYMCSIGSVMNAALPNMLNLSSESELKLNTGFEDQHDRDQEEEIIMKALSEISYTSLSDLKKYCESYFNIRSLNRLIKSEAVVLRESIKESYKPKVVSMLVLGSEVKSKAFDEVVKKLQKAPAQLKALMHYIEDSGFDGKSFTQEQQTKTKFQKKHDISPAIIKSLIDKGILAVEEIEESRFSEGNETDGLKKMSPLQKDKFDEIKNQFQDHRCVLLHGVTSSGKTEVYAHLIEEVLSEGGQVLYLLPEIALTNQLIRRLRSYFGDAIGLYHSRLSGPEKAEVWMDVLSEKDNRFKIVLGARSSVFLPFNDLKLIIVDEEHDRSFKQQRPAPRYSGRDAAMVLAGIHGAKVLLGSATPSLESKLNALSGKYGHVEMMERFGGFNMPEVKVVDIIDSRKRRRMEGSFTQRLIDEMDAAYEQGEQIILFQNRRGYAPFMVCEHCAHTPNCVNCDVSLTHHKFSKRLICHQCGYSIPVPNACSQCGSGLMLDKGTGTERIEEELASLRPSWRLARFDLDSTRKKHAFNDLIGQFEDHEIDVLIGTQMVTKGLDFENVGLVGIINADQMLKFPDFRAFERSFQMLTQVSGRAGRKQKRGRVIIQTYDHQHPIIQHVLNNDYDTFAREELKERELFKYAPYYRMIAVYLRHRDRQKLLNAAQALGKLLKSNFGDALLGPEFPYIERTRNYYTMHFMLRIHKTKSIVQAKNLLEQRISAFLEKKEYQSIQVVYDVDPNS